MPRSTRGEALLRRQGVAEPRRCWSSELKACRALWTLGKLGPCQAPCGNARRGFGGGAGEELSRSGSRTPPLAPANWGFFSDLPRSPLPVQHPSTFSAERGALAGDGAARFLGLTVGRRARRRKGGGRGADGKQLRARTVARGAC